MAAKRLIVGNTVHYVSSGVDYPAIIYSVIDESTTEVSLIWINVTMGVPALNYASSVFLDIKKGSGTYHFKEQEDL